MSAVRFSGIKRGRRITQTGIDSGSFIDDAGIPSQNSSQQSTPPFDPSLLLTPTSDDEKKEDKSATNSAAFFTVKKRRIDNIVQAPEILTEAKSKLEKVMKAIISSNSKIDELDESVQRKLLSEIFLEIARIYRKTKFANSKKIEKHADRVKKCADLTVEAFVFAINSAKNSQAEVEMSAFKKPYSHFLYGIMLAKFPLPKNLQNKIPNFAKILSTPREDRTKADNNDIEIVNRHIKEQYSAYYKKMSNAFESDVMGFFKYFITNHVKAIEANFHLRAGLIIDEIADCITSKFKSLHNIELLKTAENASSSSATSTSATSVLSHSGRTLSK